MNPLFISNVYEKLQSLDGFLRSLPKAISMANTENHPRVPLELGRDIEVVHVKQLPPKRGFTHKEGQARLLHDLASIELQAMELGLRTLIEFPDAPAKFREELTEVVRDEARHLDLCLRAMQSLGFKWGDWPCHVGLWHSTGADDSFIDRIVIVHRYLEGSGLDASATLLRRLDGVRADEAHEVVKVISTDELPHVQFGSRWYREMCLAEGMNPDLDFQTRLPALMHRIPRRLEPLDQHLRNLAGFSDSEIETVRGVQKKWLDTSRSEKIHQSNYTENFVSK